MIYICIFTSKKMLSKQPDKPLLRKMVKKVAKKNEKDLKILFNYFLTKNGYTGNLFKFYDK